MEYYHLLDDLKLNYNYTLKNTFTKAIEFRGLVSDNPDKHF